MRFPASLDVIVCNEILLEKQSLPPALQNRLVRLAAFQNPEFQRAQAMRLGTYGKPRIVSCAQDYPHHIGLPPGCLEAVLQLLADLKVSPIIRDGAFPEDRSPLHFTASSNPTSKPPRKRCWPTTAVCCPRPRLLARR